ncbi:MAG: hypothetical protein COU83_00045 [Candidatus Portnoybacteria bacterium CG10_big_fil_rev_8_21_14_0_10_40_22]|uniref:Uncharacterized protein n=1 Tax=Candidatus Portnoybacteria bacterium CG10_big_fil_rev_8_21_14_0_10_40_22 TaxID=1974814 RepID=A0A2M8KH49_9BACT|nr:MAG: hypothetical protein COU83_00045 [Candidatus Portnoybacteria bacterium CG10_big_fil_rev_8_21_14_0_10_40_22]
MALLTKPQQKTAPIAAFAVDDYFFRSMAQDIAALSPNAIPTTPQLPKPKTRITPEQSRPAEQPPEKIDHELKFPPQIRPRNSSTVLSPLARTELETPQIIKRAPQLAQPLSPPEPNEEQKFSLSSPAAKTSLPISPIIQKSENIERIQQAQAKKFQDIEANKQKQIKENEAKQAEELYKSAKQLYKKKNYRETVVNLQESLRIRPDSNKSKRYLLKAQKRLAETEKKQQIDAIKIQQQAQEIALRQAEENIKRQMAQETEQAKIKAQQEIQQQTRALEQKIIALKTEHQKLLDQQDVEKLKIEKAQQEKFKIEALIRAQEELRQQTNQQKNQQIDTIRQQVEQRSSQQLNALQQQLNQQEEALQRVQTQNTQFEKQRQDIQDTTRSYEQKLRQFQSQAQPSIDKPLSAPSPLTPLSSGQSITPLPPSMITPTNKPLQTPPPIQPPKPLPQISSIAKPQPNREQKFLFPTTKQSFPLKKLIIGIGAACLILTLAGIIYWRFALKSIPTPPSPATITLKNPNAIIKLVRPNQETAGWQKIVRLTVSNAIKLPLENYQIEPFKDIDPWLGKELFYLNFDDAIDINQLSGAFIWAIDDKQNGQTLFEKIKSRQHDQVSLQNYRQFDLVNCQNQYWAFADVFNLHYLVLSQNLSSIKSVLDNFSEKNLDFIEYAESQTAFWRALPNTSIYFWIDPAKNQTSLWQIFRQLNLDVPIYVNQPLKNQASIILLDNLSPEIKDTRLAVIFGFTDFDGANQAMTNWEKTLSHDVNFLFWNLKPTLPSTLNFQGNIYNNAVIRYLTMPDKNLGIYYGLTKEQLILTNSEDGVKMLIDNLQGS